MGNKFSFLEMGVTKIMQDMIYIQNKIIYSMNKEIKCHNSLVNSKHYLEQMKKVKKNLDKPNYNSINNDIE